ncbi:MAG: PDZ domain-containing protein [Bacteroidetes bacterium]|nr:PDZ domain-containing protein [Bacteroidota bacterium]
MIKNIFKKKWLLISGITTISIFSLGFVADSYFEISKNIDIFITLYRDINTYYVDETDPGKLMKTAIDNMLESLDPYTNYISESEIEDYRFQVTGQYGGLGLQIAIRDNYPMITDVYDGTPSQKSGLLPGDVIIKIDGQDLKNKSTSDVSKLLKGQPKTKIELTIKRDGEAPLVKEMERDEIHVKNVPYYGMLDETTGYIALKDFRNDAGKDVALAYRDLKTKKTNLKHIVLDLRGNPGGLLIEAVNVVNVFIPRNQLVVSTRGKIKEWEKEYKTNNNPVDETMPLIVLTDRGSASASEIVGGTIQDLDRGLTVGQRSFGKGLVQSTRPVSYGTQLKVTTAKYYTPSGRCIQALNYSHRNEDGSVGEIPDSLKKMFKTRNGRKVFDGGGIAPDLKVEDQKVSNVTIALKNKFFIFDFATAYHKKHPTIEIAKDFKLTKADWDDFITFIKDKKYDYQTQSEKALEELKKKAEAEKYFEKIQSTYESLKRNLETEKKADIETFKQEIMNEIESEIVKRYYFEVGTIEHSFRNDKDVKAALQLFMNENEYNKLIKP